MDFILYKRPSGQIDSVRSAQINGEPVSSAEEILTVIFGANHDGYGAIPYDGSDLSGKRVDVANGTVVTPPSSGDEAATTALKASA